MHLPISRFGCRIFFAAFLAAAGTATVPTFAEAPLKAATQAPGFYRMQLGDFEVTALYDGYTMIDRKLLRGAGNKDLETLLARNFLPTDGGVQTAVNAYLVNTGKNLVLVDTGSAKCFGPTMGFLGDNIRAAGYAPERIDTVLLTHLHPDHACGLLRADGKMLFPNAKVRVAKSEAEYWLSETVAAQAPSGAQGLFKMARDAVAPYSTAKQFETYDANDTLLPGLIAVPSTGHTPGHTSYLFQSQGQNLLVWGDIVHSHAVQFARPEVSLDYDSDGKKAVATRKSIFARVAKDKLWVAGAHLPFPGIGHVHRDAQGYRWVPVEYAPLKKVESLGGGVVPPASTSTQQRLPDALQKAQLIEQTVMPPPNNIKIVDGGATWKLDAVSVGEGKPLETVIRGHAEFPEAKFAVDLVIRRNTDSTLPATHTITISVSGESNHATRAVKTFGALTVKDQPNALSPPLRGVMMPLTETASLLALYNTPQDSKQNMELLRTREWFDLPLTYSSNQNALVVFEKGTEGRRVFDEAFRDWGSLE